MMVSRRLLERLAGRVTLGSALCALCLPVLADDSSTRIKALETQLETSLQLIEKLSARVDQLERAAKAGESKPDASTTAERDRPARDASRPQEIADPVAASQVARETGTGLPLRGFADVGAIWSTARDPAKLRGFRVGTLDVYLTPQFNDRVKALAEVAIEFDEHGTGSIEIERLQLGYAASDELTLWGGRFHTPFGLWNTLFHHGAVLQTSISRPRFIEFEDKGGIMPVHSVGAWATGSSRLGAGKLSYDGYLANAPSIRERRLDPNSFGDSDGVATFGFNVGYMPQASGAGLKIGVHGFASTVKSFTSSNETLGRTRLRTTGAYLGYDSDGWEAIGEYYHFANVDVATSARHSSNAWFMHVGRTFGSLTPFVRFERASLDPNDNYFAAQRSGRSYSRSAFGALYALDSRSAIKFELSRTNENALIQLDENGGLVPFAGGTYRRTALQYSIAF
jgi:hypothetical protein